MTAPWDAGKKLQMELIEDILNTYTAGADAANALFGCLTQCLLALEVEMERTHTEFSQKDMDAMLEYARLQVETFRAEQEGDDE